MTQSEKEVPFTRKRFEDFLTERRDAFRHNVAEFFQVLERQYGKLTEEKIAELTSREHFNSDPELRAGFSLALHLSDMAGVYDNLRIITQSLGGAIEGLPSATELDDRLEKLRRDSILSDEDKKNIDWVRKFMRNSSKTGGKGS